MRRLFIGILVLLFIGICQHQSYCASQWDKNNPSGTSDAADIDSYVTTINNEALDRLNYDHRQGCIISYSSASAISVSIGTLALPNTAGTVVRWRRNTSATSVGWSDIDTGSEASSTTYYVYGVADTDATTFTCKISTNASVPSGVTYYRRLGYFYNDSSGNITQIVNDDDAEEIAYIKGQGNYYKIDSGTATVPGNSYANVSFTFTFASAPIVTTGINVNVGGGRGDVVGVYDVTTTGCKISAGNDAGDTVYWIAIGQVLAQ